MSCNDCPNRALFKYLTEEKKDIALCPICYLKRFKERLSELPPQLLKIENNLKIEDGFAELNWEDKDKPLWTGVDHE